MLIAFQLITFIASAFVTSNEVDTLLGTVAIVSNTFIYIFTIMSVIVQPISSETRTDVTSNCISASLITVTIANLTFVNISTLPSVILI